MAESEKFGKTYTRHALCALAVCYCRWLWLLFLCHHMIRVPNNNALITRSLGTTSGLTIMKGEQKKLFSINSVRPCAVFATFLYTFVCNAAIKRYSSLIKISVSIKKHSDEGWPLSLAWFSSIKYKNIR